MKKVLMMAAAVATVVVFSGAASADGNCASKNGAHKDMSAAASKNGKLHHGWVASKDAVTDGASVVSKTEVKQEVPAQLAPNVLKI